MRNQEKILKIPPKNLYAANLALNVDNWEKIGGN
jgi:hypothetical protein